MNSVDIILKTPVFNVCFALNETFFLVLCINTANTAQFIQCPLFQLYD